MTEHIRAIPDLTGLHWADGGTPETSTEPDESLKDDGYAPNAKPASVAWNWREREIGRWAAWSAGNAIRRFPTLSEGIAATSPGDVFRVDPATGLALPRLNNWLSIETGGAPASWCTDGRLVYVGYGAFVYAYSAATGLLVWDTAELAENVEHICTDGGRVFVAYSDGTVGLIVDMLDCVDGATLDSITLAATLCANATQPLACNGTYLAVAGEQGTATGVMVIDYAAAAFGTAAAYTWEVGGVASTIWAYAVTMGDTWLALSGKKNASNRILDYVNLSDLTRLASATDAGWTSDPEFYALANDGDKIYASGTQGNYTGFGTDYVWEYPAYAAAGIKVEWPRTGWGSTVTGALVVGPGVRAFTVTGSGCMLFDEGYFALASMGATFSFKPQGFDGLNLWAADTTGTDNLRAYALNLAPRLFRRASDLDPTRRAPGMLAQPVR